MRKELAQYKDKTVRFAGVIGCVEEGRFLLGDVVVSSYYNSKNVLVKIEHIWIYEKQSIYHFDQGFEQWQDNIKKHAQKGMCLETIGVVKEYCRKDRSHDYGIVIKPCMSLSKELEGVEYKSSKKQEEIFESALDALKKESLLFGVGMSYTQVKKALTVALAKVKESIKLHDKHVSKQFRGKISRDPFKVPANKQSSNAKGFSICR